MSECRVVVKLGSHKLVHGYHKLREHAEKVRHEGVVCLSKQDHSLLWQLSLMILLIPDEPQQVYKLLRVVVPVFAHVLNETGIELPRPAKLVDEFVLLADSVELGLEDIVVHLNLLVLLSRLVLQLVAHLLNDLEFDVVAPEEDMVDELCGLAAEPGILLDHHGDHVLKLLVPLLNEVFGHLRQVKPILEYILLSDVARSEGMLSS